MLSPVFQALRKLGQVSAALLEKTSATKRWQRIEALAMQLRTRALDDTALPRQRSDAPDRVLGLRPWSIPVAPTAVLTSARYGRRLSEIIQAAWHIIAQGLDDSKYDTTSHSLSYNTSVVARVNCSVVRGWLSTYDNAWAGYHAMHNSYTWMASEYVDYYWSSSLDQKPAGLGTTIDRFRALCPPETMPLNAATLN